MISLCLMCRLYLLVRPKSNGAWRPIYTRFHVSLCAIDEMCCRLRRGHSSAFTLSLYISARRSGNQDGCAPEKCVRLRKDTHGVKLPSDRLALQQQSAKARDAAWGCVDFGSTCVFPESCVIKHSHSCRPESDGPSEGRAGCSGSERRRKSRRSRRACSENQTMRLRATTRRITKHPWTTLHNIQLLLHFNEFNVQNGGPMLMVSSLFTFYKVYISATWKNPRR